MTAQYYETRIYLQNIIITKSENFLHHAKRTLCTMLNAHFGKLLQNLIDRKGTTKEEAAKIAEMSVSNFYRTLKRQDLDTSILRRFLNYYNTPLTSLLPETKPYTFQQQGGQNVVGEKIINYAGGNVTSSINDNSASRVSVLENALNSCEVEREGLKKQIALLEKLLSMYESKPK